MDRGSDDNNTVHECRIIMSQTPPLDGDKKQSTSSGVPMPVDERMLQYQAMAPEKSLGVDKENGR